MKIRTLTIRSHNLDAEVIMKLNRVIRGTVNYFAQLPPRTTKLLGPLSSCQRTLVALPYWGNLSGAARCGKAARR